MSFTRISSRSYSTWCKNRKYLSTFSCISLIKLTGISHLNSVLLYGINLLWERNLGTCNWCHHSILIDNAIAFGSEFWHLLFRFLTSWSHRNSIYIHLTCYLGSLLELFIRFKRIFLWFACVGRWLFLLFFSIIFFLLNRFKLSLRIIHWMRCVPV